MTTYDDRSVYQLLLDIASRDVEADGLSFDPTDVATIARDDRRAAVWPSEDGASLEWELLTYPTRRGRRWNTCATGAGDETEMRTAVREHLNVTDGMFESAAS